MSGQCLINLFTTKAGQEWLSKHNSPLYISIINTEDEESYYKVYEDQFQVALIYNEVSEVIEHSFIIYNLQEWEDMIKCISD